jgi:hypothetical protein
MKVGSLNPREANNMLQIKCDHCGQTLKGKDVEVTTFDAYVGKAKYKDYDVTCTKCGGSIMWDRYTQKAAENKAKALAKLARKKKTTVKQITEAEKYSIIMSKAGKRAQDFVLVGPVKLQHLNRAIEELPQDERNFVLSYEDKHDMTMLKAGTKKSTKHIRSNAILLLTQAIIESGIEENDVDFFKSEYGAFVVDTYNAALTNHKHHDYGITAALLLEKMRKGKIHVKGEDDDA